jgi:hypothetical protein
MTSDEVREENEMEVLYDKILKIDKRTRGFSVRYPETYRVDGVKYTLD